MADEYLHALPISSSIYRQAGDLLHFLAFGVPFALMVWMEDEECWMTHVYDPFDHWELAHTFVGLTTRHESMRFLEECTRGEPLETASM